MHRAQPCLVLYFTVRKKRRSTLCLQGLCVSRGMQQSEGTRGCRVGVVGSGSEHECCRSRSDSRAQQRHCQACRGCRHQPAGDGRFAPIVNAEFTVCETWPLDEMQLQPSSPPHLRAVGTARKALYDKQARVKNTDLSICHPVEISTPWESRSCCSDKGWGCPGHRCGTEVVQRGTAPWGMLHHRVPTVQTGHLHNARAPRQRCEELEEKQCEQEAPAGLGSPLQWAPGSRTSWCIFDGLVGGCSVHTKRGESLRSLMKGHSILGFSKRHLFLQ